MRTLEMSLGWMNQGTEMFTAALAELSDEQLTEPIALSGWTGKHLLAHLANNAEALGNLVEWARTGIETPMYSSNDQRAADIESGAQRPVAELRERYAETAATLASRLEGLSEQQWEAGIRTNAGRPVQGTEIPWMRAREVMVHTVDLGAKTFGDLPVSFLGALLDDVTAKRATDGTPTLEILSRNTGESWRIEGDGDSLRVMAMIDDLAAWLTGRSDGAGVKVLGPGELPALPKWL
ncbi:maleylpyruvate isomerase family mycothiol-dependent enzyme [Ammonicoccus fulvus]|uniref:Maleylpyruvate isomerase family mycothiol-dependent enzyme n=1 Tax=Ammonicoccus fulvus TaxID=3138240 RepID=A0ABZ3FVR3_9ACTN